MLRATRDVLADHRRKISFSHKDLSNSFRHAFAICRKLKIQYAWIDSLCIIQDDKDDWEAEAAKMKDVYAGAYLVLSAAAAANGGVGCLFRRPPSHKIPFHSSNGREISLQIRKSTAFHHKIFTDDQPKHDETTFPLLSQGWTLQERLLAQRVLHFGPLEMIWDCCCSIDCECLETGSVQDHCEGAAVQPLAPVAECLCCVKFHLRLGQTSCLVWSSTGYARAEPRYLLRWTLD